MRLIRYFEFNARYVVLMILTFLKIMLFLKKKKLLLKNYIVLFYYYNMWFYSKPGIERVLRVWRPPNNAYYEPDDKIRQQTRYRGFSGGQQPNIP